MKKISIFILLCFGLLNIYFYFNYPQYKNDIKWKYAEIKYNRNLTKKVWIIMDDFYCKDLNEFSFPRNWEIFSRNKNTISNCQDDELIYFRDDEFLKDLIINDIEKLGVFQTLENDFFIWNDPYTLHIDKRNSVAGKVCRNIHHSMTIETYDFPMRDWKIPFYVKGRLVPFNPRSNLLLEKSSFWIFPLLRDKKTIGLSFGYLSRQSKIRTIDVRSKMIEKNIKGITKGIIDKNVEQFLSKLPKTGRVLSTLQTLREISYEWPNLNNSDWGNFCSPVLWRQTGNHTVKDADCHEIKVNFTGQAPMIDDILLIVVFNNPLYHVMPLVNNLYINLFKYIAYCGPNEIPKDYKGLFVQYINMKGKRTGLLGNICASVYLKMRHKHTKGFLIIHDDLILNVHQLRKYPIDNFVIPVNDRQIKENYWALQKNDLVSAMEDLYSSKDSDFRKCTQVLTTPVRHSIRKTLRGSFADIYFIPYKMSREFVKLNDYFVDKRVSFMVAVPTIMDCLQNVVYSKTTPYATRDRNKQWQKAHELPKKLYIHPVKWGKIIKGKPDYKLRQHLYCRTKYFINDKKIQKGTMMYIYNHRKNFPTFY